jgi:2-dehydro-3-deoxygluconokinase
MSEWDITAIGEGGLRLSTPAGIPLERAASLDVAIAGAEANVLATLAALGWRSCWASVLPRSPQGRRVERELRASGVHTDLVKHVPEGRVGVYFVEYGARPRPTEVYFDRRDTAFSKIGTQDVEWDRLLDTRVLHLTGVTAAVSETACRVVEEAASRARAAGVPVSFDVNFRAKMWSEQEARPRLVGVLESADIVFIRLADAALLFGSESVDDALAAVRRLSSARAVAVTNGAAGASAVVDGHRYDAAAVEVRIIDRLGSGDAFAAGFLHCILQERTADVLSYATMLAAMCLSQTGEQVATTREAVDRAISAPHIGLSR